MNAAERSWKPIQTPTRLEPMSPMAMRPTKMRIGRERLRRGAGAGTGLLAGAALADGEVVEGVMGAAAGAAVVGRVFAGAAAGGAPRGPGIR